MKDQKFVIRIKGQLFEGPDMTLSCSNLISYRLPSVTDEARAGVAMSSLVHGGKVVHQAWLGEVGDSIQSPLWFIPFIATIYYVMVPELNSTGIAAL